MHAITNLFKAINLYAALAQPNDTTRHFRPVAHAPNHDWADRANLRALLFEKNQMIPLSFVTLPASEHLTSLCWLVYSWMDNEYTVGAWSFSTFDSVSTFFELVAR